MSRSGNKYLIYGLVTTLVALLFLNNSYVNGGRVIFACRNNCVSTPNALDQTTTNIASDTTVDSANIFRAPTKCKADEVLVNGNKCRRRYI